MTRERRVSRGDRRSPTASDERKAAPPAEGPGANPESPPQGALINLTARQREVLHLMAQGCSNAAIAGQLGLAVKSVENAINTIYQALSISSMDPEIHPRVKAVLTYLHPTGRKSPSPSRPPRAGRPNGKAKNG